MDWDARPSTLPRRQGRRGRAFDFAQWYPKVVVYDQYGWEEHPLYPAGEFYGEFAHVRRAPGRARGPGHRCHRRAGRAATPDGRGPKPSRAGRSTISADYYGARPPLEIAARAARTRSQDACALHAEQTCTISRCRSTRTTATRAGNRVPRWSTCCISPGDEKSWGGGVAVARTETALAWLGPCSSARYPWPQFTNVHRIEGGGTEFPMMIMDGSAGQGLIVHEARAPLPDGHAGQQRVARGLARRGLHRVPDRAVRRDPQGRRRLPGPDRAVPARDQLDGYARAGRAW